MSHETWLEHADVYALGVLDGEELRHFEAHLATGCGPCTERIRETRDALTLLPRSLPAVAPPPDLRARVMERIATERPRPLAPAVSRRAERRAGWFVWGGWASALAAAGLLVAVTWELSGTRAELASLAERLGALQGRLATLLGEVAAREETLRILTDPDARYVNLAGLPASPKASGWLAWNPRTRQGLLLTANLPETPPDRVYELWALAGSEPVPAGVFTVDRAGRALFRLPTLPEGQTFDKFAVTVEPVGGVPKPTGAMHLLGTL